MYSTQQPAYYGAPQVRPCLINYYLIMETMDAIFFEVNYAHCNHLTLINFNEYIILVDDGSLPWHDAPNASKLLMN